MQAKLSKKLRFSDVAYAINATPKSLRLWLQRGLVEIDTPKPEGGKWIEYSFYDVAILAIARAVADFGVEVSEAGRIGNTVLTDFFPKMLNRLKDPGDIPVGAMTLDWSNRRLHVFRDPNGWQLKLVDLWKSNLNARQHEGFDPNLPSGIAELRTEQEFASVYLVIDVETVLRTAFSRANESVNEGADDDEDS